MREVLRLARRGLVLALLALALPAAAKRADLPAVLLPADGVIQVEGRTFASWSDYVRSDLFQERGLRCGTAPAERLRALAGAGDCTLGSTNPAAEYDPAVGRYRIPVVVHVIQHSNGTGFVGEAAVRGQIEILNEDFLALLGSNGQYGVDIQVEFFLATQDPAGAPTNGITYSVNDSWFNDRGAYWDNLAWDPRHYLNIYTNLADGVLGYVPDLPQSGLVGSNEDRVVILWSAFGPGAPIGPPFDQGRTLTHEVGHYLGLEHTFAGGCASAGACYTNGDLICDTNPQADATDGCGDAGSCGSPDPYRNYMDYSDDLCMEGFTPEQARRMRCSLEHYRPELFAADTTCGNGVLEAGEQCDDGNTVAGDGCDASCALEPVCGNGVLEAGEECDDGNLSAGDGCSAICRREGHDCCDTGHGAGCSDPDIEACVCADDAFCCTDEWDALCADEVDTLGCGSCQLSLPAEVSPPGSQQPLRFLDAATLTWEEAAVSGSDTFNLYRGEIAALLGGSGACLDSGLGSNSATDAALPPAGACWTYLVAGRNSAGDGSVGNRSAGTPRPEPASCP